MSCDCDAKWSALMDKLTRIEADVRDVRFALKDKLPIAWINSGMGSMMPIEPGRTYSIQQQEWGVQAPMPATDPMCPACGNPSSSHGQSGQQLFCPGRTSQP